MIRLVNSKTVRYSAVGSLLTALTVAISACADQAQVEVPSFGFSIDLEPGWNHAFDRGGVALAAWPDSGELRGVALTVSIDTVPEEATNENYADLASRTARSSLDFSLIDSGSISIDGETVPYLSYDLSIAGSKRRAIMATIIAPDRNLGYVLQGLGTREEFPRARETFLEMFRTFERD